VQASDEGLQGLIAAGMASTEKDAAVKSQLETLAQQKVAIAKAAKDETLKWDEELAKVKGGITSASVDQGATSPEIEALKAKIAANPKDTDAIYKLAQAYQEVKNWNGAILTWSKMSSALPDWAPAYYSQGYAYQQAGNNEMAKTSYEKFISLVKPAEIEASKQSLGYAYFFMAFMEKDTNPEKAKQDIAKSLEYDPTYPDAINLQKTLNK
jgi:tetratricopeptide (TPR) repeat protein